MRRTGRSALFQQLRRSFFAAHLSNQNVEKSWPGCRSSNGISRRQFLAGATAAVLAAYFPTVSRAQANGPRIAVVGAGIAGLNAAYLLAKAGINVTVYEGANHTGGRIQTNVGGVTPGVYTEMGGEFIDSGHEDMLALAKLFKLELIDTQAPSEAGMKMAYYAKGKLWSEAEVIDAFKPVAAIVHDHHSKLSDEIKFDSHSAFDAQLDNTDLRKYLQANVKTEWLYDVLESAYVNEYGLNLEEQSALNFVETIGTDLAGGFKVYGESDQRFKIVGGNQQIVDALAKEIAGRIELGHKLRSLSQNANGVYQLTFERSGQSDRAVEADVVVMCLPFTVLRDIELKVDLPAVKRKAIAELGYGTNAKLILGFKSRVWRDAGFGGDSYADLAFQSGWDSSREQPGTAGAYTIFEGGTKGTDLKPGSAEDQAKRLLPGLDKVFAGTREQWLGTALRAYWPENPFVKGSYAAYRVGQWTGIRGAEGMPVGKLFFAGEHTSLDWQGYMNGGAESGRLAAKAVMG
jgi:monoamine oxidase